MSERRNDLDAIRSFAMALGIAVHASLAFYQAPWPVHDTRPSGPLALLVLAIHGFRMPLFFLLSGYFTMLVYRRRGLGSLVQQRFARIALPLGLAMATIGPLDGMLQRHAIRSHRLEPAIAEMFAGDADAVRLRFTAGADAEGRDAVFRRRMLSWAACSNQPAVVAAVLDAGADVNARGGLGDTTLHEAVAFGRDEAVAVDAGSLGLLADLDRQRRVRHVFVTHEHVDHIATLPIFLENVYEPGPDCVELLGRADVLDFLHRDVFNGRVWPDFFALSTGADRFVRGTFLTPGTPVERAGLMVTPLPVSHGVDTFGLLVDDGRVAVAFPSDTGPTAEFWRRLAACPRLAAVFLECSWPESKSALAAETGHLCPSTFAAEVRKLDRDVRWIVVHRKARHAAEIARDLAALGLPNVEFVRPGFAYEF